MTDFCPQTPTALTAPAPPALVTAYLRLSGSRSAKVQLAPSTGLAELKSAVASLLGVPVEAQVLFLGGRELRASRAFELSERAILHVKDRREMLEEVTIHLVCHEPQRDNVFRARFPSTPLRVQQAERIGDFLERFLGEQAREIDLKRSRVIECGRFLRAQKSFGEEKVAQNAEVHLILRSADGVPESDQHHEMFVKRVLKHSRNNSREEMPGKGEQAERAERGKRGKRAEREEREEEGLFQRCDSQLVLKAELYEQGLCPHECLNDNPHFRHSLQPDALEKSNPEFPARRSSFLNHTKSSERWVRAKVKPSELTPIKLGLKEYKKYDGPLSVRGCNCKRPLFESRGRESAKSDEESPCLSPLPSKMVKSQCKLKKSLTVIV